jgi:parallel beta-helix repeat protein
VDAVATGSYGLFPVGSNGGLIDQCTATGLTDSGIYVGGSTNVIVRNSRAWANVVGIEIENSSHVDVLNNLVYDNTAGIGVFLLPDNPVKVSSDVRLRGNVIIGNNRPNFGDPDDLVSFAPSGVGVFVLGVDRVTIEQNVVVGNGQLGIGVGSSLLLAASGKIPPDAFSSIEPNPDGTVVRYNLVVFNGLGTLNAAFPAGDLVWDGSGVGNHWQNNVFITSTPGTLPN